jgi:hypothetical protein
MTTKKKIDKPEKIKEFNFNLSEPVSYSCKGEQIESSFITFTAPTSRNRRECAFLKQAFFKAVNSVHGSTKDVEQDVKAKVDISASDITDLLAMGSEDLSEVWEVSIKLFSSGVGMLGGEEKLTKLLLDQVHMDDLDSMVGEYLVNFTLRSSLNKMNQN